MAEDKEKAKSAGDATTAPPPEAPTAAPSRATTNVLNTAAHPIDLSTGRTLEPGEIAEGIDVDNDHDTALVDDGLLLVLDNYKSKGN
jgi:hypothetical protein